MLRTYGRFVRVVWQFVPLLVAYARDRRRFIVVGRSRRPDREVQERRARTLLEALLTLGPTFIKLGQLLSARPDVLPPAYIDVLSQLQDDVPPAPWTETEPVIEASLGPVDEAFDDFDREALSGASLGQVYRATLDGDPVAVKVRRPGVTELVETDLRVIRLGLPIVLWAIDDARAYSFENLADEFAAVITEEMDYEREARMLTSIRENFEDEPGVRMPTVAEEHSTERVLTMEYVEGIKITDVAALDDAGVDRTAVADRLIRSYLKMVIDDGVFHADPHPGNLAVQPDGTVVFYDFGMSGRVEPSTREDIVSFYIAVAERDIDGMLDALIALGTLSPEADRRVMGEVLELAIRDAKGEHIEEWRVQRIIAQVESTIYEFPLRLPSRLALVMRVATVVEGVCVTLDPDFDFVAASTAYLTEQGYREESAKRIVRDVGREAGRAGVATLRVAPKFERLLDRIDREDAYVRIGVEDPDRVFDRLAFRIVLGVFGAVAFAAAALVYAVRGIDPVAGLGAVAGIVLVLILVRSFRRRRGFTARPQFTRHRLRERRRDR